MDLKEYIRRNYKTPNPKILSDLGASEELITYLRYTPGNTNFNVSDSYSEGDRDYSKDCERTDLGELLYCGMVEDYGERREFDTNPNPNDGQFTIIIDGIEIQGTYDSSEEVVNFVGGCVTTDISVERDSETGPRKYRLLEIATDPETNPCAPRENYPNNHLALYYKAN